jgi:hypothetical protein
MCLTLFWFVEMANHFHGIETETTLALPYGVYSMQIIVSSSQNGWDNYRCIACRWCLNGLKCIPTVHTSNDNRCFKICPWWPWDMPQLFWTTDRNDIGLFVTGKSCPEKTYVICGHAWPSSEWRTLSSVTSSTIKWRQVVVRLWLEAWILSCCWVHILRLTSRFECRMKKYLRCKDRWTTIERGSRNYIVLLEYTMQQFSIWYMGSSILLPSERTSIVFTY